MEEAIGAGTITATQKRNFLQTIVRQKSICVIYPCPCLRLFGVVFLFSFSVLHSYKLEDTSCWPCLALPSALSSVPSSVSLTCFFTFHTWTLFLAVCLLLLFSKVPSSLSSPISPLLLHHLSLTPSFSPLPLPASLCLSLLAFSSGSPLIKPLCLLPPCPVSTHTSRTSLSRLVSLISVLLSLTTCISSPYAPSLILMLSILFIMWLLYTFKWYLASELKYKPVQSTLKNKYLAPKQTATDCMLVYKTYIINVAPHFSSLLSIQVIKIMNCEVKQM